MLQVIPVLVSSDAHSPIHNLDLRPLDLPPWLVTTTTNSTSWADVIQGAPMMLVMAPTPREAMTWARALVLVSIWLSDVVRAFCFARHAALPLRAPSRGALQVFMPLLQRAVSVFLESAPGTDEATTLVHTCAAGLIEARVPRHVDGGTEDEPPMKKKRTVQ
jgi:hypothetical protein